MRAAALISEVLAIPCGSFLAWIHIGLYQANQNQLHLVCAIACIACVLTCAAMLGHEIAPLIRKFLEGGE